MAYEHDPARRRWFIVSVVTTSLIAVAGWMYFFSGQVAGLVQSVPAGLASDAMKNLTNQTKELGASAVQDFKATLTVPATEAIGDITKVMEAQAKLAGVIDVMTTELSSESVEEPAPVDPTSESVDTSQ